jgi:hypothetical protein
MAEETEKNGKQDGPKEWQSEINFSRLNVTPTRNSPWIRACPIF